VTSQQITSLKVHRKNFFKDDLNIRTNLSYLWAKIITHYEDELRLESKLDFNYNGVVQSCLHLNSQKEGGDLL